jgi:mitochondrial splicing suppressor protein 51
MRPTYTCRRCLGFMRRSCLRPNLQPVGPAADIRRASISTQVGQVSSVRPKKTLTTSFKSHRSASSLENKGGGVKYESLEATPPLSLNRLPGTEESTRALLRPHNLFHRFSESPSPSIRRRAAFIKQHAYCPHPDHRQTRLSSGPDDPAARSRANASQPPMHVSFECADCGIPVYCSEEHWADDFENHLEICDTLRQINEDDHDLRSGRFFPEFEYPGPQLEEAQVNMTNWDTFLYSREFEAINSERSMRQATRLLTYPVTIGSFLHELSPYNIRSGGRLTTEGLKSLSGLLSLSLSLCVQIANTVIQQPSATPSTLHVLALVWT